MTKFRYKTEPVIGIQRPDGSLTSANVLTFIKEVTAIGGVISVIPGTNYMYLILKHNDNLSRDEIVAPILPGDWVLKDGKRFMVLPDERVTEILEEIYETDTPENNTQTKAEFPVYVPYGFGDNRVAVVVGKAAIDSEGAIDIVLDKTDAGERLGRMISEGTLLGVSFDTESANPYTELFTTIPEDETQQ